MGRDNVLDSFVDAVRKITDPIEAKIRVLEDRYDRIEDRLDAMHRRPMQPTDYRMGDDAVLRPVKRRYRHTFHVISDSPACPLPGGVTLHGKPVVWDFVEEQR